MCFPDWRPGRYELGNFAKNIKGFSIIDENGNDVEYSKTKRNEWIARTKETSSIKVIYQYYANELNAGSTFLDENQCYINPVNCLIFPERGEEMFCELELYVPSNYEFATSLNRKDGVFTAENYHELVDSPIIASPTLQHKSFENSGINFHIWFQGEVKPDWDRIIEDFQKYTTYQINKFGGFPVDEYHYLFQIDTKNAYHGVEHQKSTVLYLGPSYDVFGKLYTELLGVCSHELYHTWNVKAIRPADWFPYNYKRENYSQLGVVAEGVTTYMGDRILFESGVFDVDQYHKELGNYLMRHLHNDGRKYYSVADSGFDTWIDGYVAGTPGRKTSIYTEGCLIAYICDMRIRESTNNDYSLHDAMKKLYEMTNQKMGFDLEQYFLILEKVGGTSFQDIQTDLVFGTESFMPYLEKALSFDGRILEIVKSNNNSESLGMKINANGKVIGVLEGSITHNSGLVLGDEIVAVNNITINKNLNNWLSYFEKDSITFTVNRNNHIIKVTLVEEGNIGYPSYKLRLMQ